MRIKRLGAYGPRGSAARQLTRGTGEAVGALVRTRT